MPQAIPFVLAALVAVVAWGVGGYAPWATLVLEVSAVLLFGWIVVRVVFKTSRAEREQNTAIARSRRAHVFGKRVNVDVEITPPAGSVRRPDHVVAAGTSSGLETSYLFGYPFRRSGVGAAAVALTFWMLMSLVPLRASWLSFLSPTAHSLRENIGELLGGVPLGSSPWSVTPFLSYQDLLLWLAYAMIFWTTYQLAASSRAVRRLTLSLVVVGVASGGYGLVQWLSSLGASFADAAPAGGLMATGSFGNRNHYAFFQEMVLLIGIGWLALQWREAERRARDRIGQQEAKARTGLFALGVAVIGLSLLFSLSRSGITFATAGVGALFFLTRSRRSLTGKSQTRARLVFVGLTLCLAVAASWIGVDPIVDRFELVPQELQTDQSGRVAVWRDSLGAVEDFWLTGSGLSSFQYVFPIYRSFGGRRFYSWAHNDYLQVAIELGLPGLILAGLIAAWILRRARRVRFRLADQPGWSDLHAGYCAAAVAVAMHSFTDFGLRLPANAALFAVTVGVVTGMTPDRRSRRQTKTRKKKLRRSPPST